MNLFIDSADLTEITKAFDTGLISGVTTNPTLIRKSGRNPFDVYTQLSELGVPDVSMEVAGDYDQMLAQAFELHYKYEGCCNYQTADDCRRLTSLQSLVCSRHSH